MTDQIAIIYATKEGQTKRIADYVAEGLADRGFEPELLDATKMSGDFDFADCDGAIVGASIHAGKFPKGIYRLVRNHREALEPLVTAFFSVSLLASLEDEDSQKTTRRLIDEFCDEISWEPTMVESFAGAVPFSEYGFIKRTIMKFILKRQTDGDVDTSQDYEYTDWGRVDEFVERYEDEFRELTVAREGPRAGR